MTGRRPFLSYFRFVGAVRLLDRISAALYLGVSIAGCGGLLWLAATRSWWILLLAVPAVATTALLFRAWRGQRFW